MSVTSILRGENATSVTHFEHGYTSTIYDAGYRLAFDYRPKPSSIISVLKRLYDASLSPLEQLCNWIILDMRNASAQVDTIRMNSGNRHVAHEWTAYAERMKSISTATGV